MIYSLTGKIIKKTLNAVVICCGGVGYYAQCPASVAGALPGVGNEATIYTVMNVTENDVSLYGFASEEQGVVSHDREGRSVYSPVSQVVLDYLVEPGQAGRV